jgi:hypothetical protein
MARINRSDVIQKAVNDLAISTSTEKIPNETLDKVQLTYSLNRQYSNWVESIYSTATGTQTLTLPTIDSRSEIYLTSLDFHIIKSVLCDIATSNVIVNITPFESGIIKGIIQVPQITLTASENHVHCDFTYPIKLKSNTNITAPGNFTAGVLLRTISATGFITSTN